MNPAQFRHRINVQRPIEAKDELGQIETTWEDVKMIWAMIKTVQGREYVAASATQNENSVRFVVRYTKGIDSTMRIVYKDRVYEIENVINDDEMNKTLTIIAKG